MEDLSIKVVEQKTHIYKKYKKKKKLDYIWAYVMIAPTMLGLFIFICGQFCKIFILVLQRGMRLVAMNGLD